MRYYQSAWQHLSVLYIQAMHGRFWNHAKPADCTRLVCCIHAHQIIVNTSALVYNTNLSSLCSNYSLHKAQYICTNSAGSWTCNRKKIHNAKSLQNYSLVSRLLPRFRCILHEMWKESLEGLITSTHDVVCSRCSFDNHINYPHSVLLLLSSSTVGYSSPEV